MIKKIILSSPFQLTSNYPGTAMWYICVEMNYAWYHLPCSISHSLPSLSALSASGTHIHSEIGCLLPLSLRKEQGQELGRGEEEGEKKRRSRTQRLAYRDSGARSGGERHLPGRQVNRGHAAIIGGPHVETDLYSAWTTCPRWHCVYNINPLEKVCVRDGGVPFSSSQIL